MVSPLLNGESQCIHNDLCYANLFKHISGHRKYGISEIESMERWGDVFSASLRHCGVCAGDGKYVCLHDRAVRGPTVRSRRREGNAVPAKPSLGKGSWRV